MVRGRHQGAEAGTKKHRYCKGGGRRTEAGMGDIGSTGENKCEVRRQQGGVGYRQHKARVRLFKSPAPIIST